MKLIDFMSQYPDEQSCKNVITHEPPLAILDDIDGSNWGSMQLLRRVYEVKPTLHLFGHTHGNWGRAEKDGILFSNAALLDRYLDLKFSPAFFEI